VAKWRMQERVVQAVLVVGLWLASGIAQAGMLDSLFAKKDDLGPVTQREWRLDEFTIVRLATKEAGAPANQHPAVVDPAALRNQLAAVQVALKGGGSGDALFDPEELNQLTPFLVRALSLARADDDVLLLSTARRESRFSVPQGLTARLFVQGDALNLIVHDARIDFIIAYRNSRVEPHFVYGSRTQAGSSSLRSPSAASRRADWVAIPMASLGASAVAQAPVVAPQPTAIPAPTPRAVVAPAAAVAPAAVVAPAPAAKPGAADAVGEEIEQRLTTLKRLRDKGLITEDEYQQKRRELLQRL